MNDKPDNHGGGNTKAGASTGTVTRIIQVLRRVAEAEHATAPRDLAEDLGLPLSTAHRLLTLLTEEGMVTRSGKGGYVPGIQFHRLADFVRERSSLGDVAKPAMLRAVEVTNESCALGLYRSSNRTLEFVALVESRHPLTYRVPLHQPKPVFLGASGKSVLAFLPQDEIDKALEDARQEQDDRSRIDVSALAQSLREIRDAGWATSRGEKLEGAVGIAAPIFAATGRVTGSLCLTIPEGRFDPNQTAPLGELLATEATHISRALGWKS